MTTHEHEHENDPRTRLSRLLVATLLDEASPAERAEVETALERDPELRAERARLEATIGLVQSLDDTSAPEHLSPAAAAKLAAAAEGRAASGNGHPFGRSQGATRSWASSPTFRMAASFALLVGALAAWRATQQGEMAPASARGTLEDLSRGFEVAQVPAEEFGEPPPGIALDESVIDRLAGYGYGGGSGGRVTDKTRALGYDGGITDAPSDHAQDPRQNELADGVPRDERYSFDVASPKGFESFGVPVHGQPDSSRGLPATQAAGEERTIREGLASTAAPVGGGGGGGGGNAPLESQSALSGTDDFYLGRRAEGEADPMDSTSLGAVMLVQQEAAPVGPSSPGPPGSTGDSFAANEKMRARGAGKRAGEADTQAGYRFYEDAAGAMPELAELADLEQAAPAAEEPDAASLALYARVLVEDLDGGEDTLELLRQIGYVDPDADDDAQVAAGLTALGYSDFGELAFENELKNEIAVQRKLADELKQAPSRFKQQEQQIQLLERKLGELQANRELRGRRSTSFGLTPAQRAVTIDQLLATCRRRPDERPRDMFYRWWGDNAFEVTQRDALSTFAVDVDTASYTLARRYLVDGILPEKAQIRTEEFVNYFKGDVPPPLESTFAIATEFAPSLFNQREDTWMLRVALRGKEVAREERKPLALTFVVDVSGSMKEENRLELVKHAMRLLIGELDARDSIAIVAFTNDARMILPMTSARHRALIESAIYPLAPEGGTNVEAGLRMGYEAALVGLSSEANNRVVLLSDGVGNIGETDAVRLNEAVGHARDRGVYLNTVGVGMDNHNDAFLEQLANKGDGLCNYVDDEDEARRALVENFTGAFEPIARDVKIQVEFDPSQVARYRLLGYENRAVADVDFRNDAVDAGEVGAGHQVVALYEVERTGNSDPVGALATVRVRWLQPWRTMTSNQMAELPATEIAHEVSASKVAGSYEASSAGYRQSVLVAQLAEFLRRSIHARPDSFSTLLAESRKLQGELADPEFDEFVEMVEATVGLLTNEWGRYDGLARRLDALRMQRYLQAQIEDLSRDLDRQRVEQIEQQCQELESEIRSLLETR